MLDDRAADVWSQIVEAVDHGRARLGRSLGECRQSTFAASRASFRDDRIPAYPAACPFPLLWVWLRENGVRNAKGIERAGESGIDRQLHQRFGDFRGGQARLDAGFDMKAQQIIAIARGAEHRDDRDLSCLWIESLAAEYLTERKLDRPAGELR